MNWRNTTQAFGLGSRVFHWVTALLVLCLLAAGLTMTSMALSPLKLKIYGFHKSFGICVLTLTFLRLMWWIGNRRPAILGNPLPWEKFLAHAVHVFFYAALIGMPLTGWAMSSAKNFPVSVFGLFTLPSIVAPDKNIAALAQQTHELLAWALIGALGLHIAGVLKHSFINKDGTLRRMVTGKTAVLAILLFTLTPAQAQIVKSWTLIPGESSITFEAKQMAAPFQGEFKDFSAQIFFDPQNLEESAVTAEIDLTSVNTKSQERDENLAKAEWFDFANFPKAKFVSKNFRQIRGNPYNYEVGGTLTVKNISKDVTLFFLFDELTPHSAKMRGEIVLNRLDFGLGAEGDWADASVVAHDVRVTIRLSALATP